MSEENQLPIVSIIMAAYNEEKVLEEKMKSVVQTKYPSVQYEILIGSDASTDNTDNIIKKFEQQGYPVKLIRFQGRSGKSFIINELVPLAKGEILIFTDANIYFSKELIPQLVSHFSDKNVGLVGANILNSGMRKDGISFQEKTYIQRENRIKYNEGLLWGVMMGAFGACYAVRRGLFKPIRSNFYMEDFFISMYVLSQGKKAINNLSAIAYEDVSNDWKEEFKRKVRISAGNFQNLGVYWRKIFPLHKPLGFSFFSHKVIRWFGPFFIIVAYLANLLLIHENLFYQILFIFQTLGMLTPIIDQIFSRIKIHNFALRLVAYFYTMNAALLVGFIKYCKGIESSIWKPTERNN
ncbi:MAG: glycosyltransferase [Chitinophagales bacterium]